MWLRRRACQGGDPSQWAAATRAKGRNGRPALKDVRLPIQQGQNAFPSAFGRGTEPAVIADALKTFGQDVLEKTAQELHHGQRQGMPPLIPTVLVFESNAPAIVGQDALAAQRGAIHEIG